MATRQANYLNKNPFFPCKQELIIYKYYDYLIPEYKMIWQRGFSDPILSLHSTDITGDGLKEVIVLTLRGVHVLQVRGHISYDQLSHVFYF